MRIWGRNDERREGNGVVVSLRKLADADRAFIQKVYPQMAEDTVKALLYDCKEKTYQGSYFEMFAVLNEALPVGTISLYQRDDAVSIGPEIVEAYQQKGIGYQAMLLALAYAKQIGYPKAVAQVRKNNIARIKLHEKCGYRISGDCVNSKGNAVYLFEREL